MHNGIRDRLAAFKNAIGPKLQQASLSFERLKKAFARIYGFEPEKEDIELGMQETKEQQNLVKVLSLFEGANVSLAVCYVMPLLYSFPVAILTVAAVAHIGEWAHRAVEEGQHSDESVFRFHFRVIRGYALLIAISAIVAVFAALRLMAFVEEKALDSQLAGTTSPFDHTTVVLAGLVGAAFSFMISLVLARKYFEYKELRRKWKPIHDAMQKCDDLEPAMAKVDSDLSSNEDKRESGHRMVDLKVHRKDERSIRWDRLKSSIGKYFAKHQLNGIAALILLPFAFNSVESQNLLRYVPVLGSQHQRTIRELVVDHTISCRGKLTVPYRTCVTEIMKTADEGDRIDLIPIDGATRTSPQTLFTVTLPDRDLIYDDKIKMALIFTKNTLVNEEDSLLSLRPSEFGWRTEIIYLMVYIASKTENDREMTVYFFSDMIEQSDIVNMMRDFDVECLIERMRSSGLVVNLSRVTLLIVTPVGQMKTETLELKRRSFWMAYFHLCRAKEIKWFGPDYIGFKQYLEARQKN